MRQEATVRLHRATQIINANNRLDRWEVASRTATLVEFGKLVLGRKMKPEPGRAVVTFEFTLPDKRNRDRANLGPTCKALLDGIVRARTVLVDDSDGYIEGPHIVIRDELSGRPGYVLVKVIIQDVGSARRARLAELEAQILRERDAEAAEKARRKAEQRMAGKK